MPMLFKTNRVLRLILSLLLVFTIISINNCAPPRHLQRTSTSSSASSEVSRESHNRMQQLERKNRDMSKRLLIYQIRQYMGTPYFFGGTTRRGMDCSGFVWKVYQKGMNLELPRSSSQMYEQCTKIGTKEVRLGDLLFFSEGNSGGIDHVGIFLFKTFFAHASSSYGVIVSDLKDDYYRSRFVRAGRFSDSDLD